MRNQRFYICRKCGNIVGRIDDGSTSIVCCNEEMKELKPNTVEASNEKHLPVYTFNNGLLEVSVGSILHPMEENHNISWVYVETKKGGQRKALKVQEEPKVSFCFYDDEPVAIYAYCNLHGLWKTEVK